MPTKTADGSRQYPDSRPLPGWEGGYGMVGFDVETNRRPRKLFPWLTGDHRLCRSPVLFFFWGHDRGSPGVEDQIVYVALLADGSQRTDTPAEFAETYGWKNDPEKAELLGKQPHSGECGHVVRRGRIRVGKGKEERFRMIPSASSVSGSRSRRSSHRRVTSFDAH